MPTFRHGKNTRVMVDGSDLSRQLNQVSVQAQQDTPETTGFTSTVKSYVTGLPDGKVDLQGMFSADYTNKEDIDDYFHSLTNATTPSTVTYMPEGLPGVPAATQTVLATRQRAYSFQGYLSNYQVHNAVADMVGVQASFVNATAGGFNSGVVLEDHITTALSTAATQAFGSFYYDYGSNAARSGWVAIHVTDFAKASATGNWIITVKGATTATAVAGNYTVVLGAGATLTIATGQAVPIGGAVFIPVTTPTSFQALSVEVQAPTTPASTTLTFAVTANLRSATE